MPWHMCMGINVEKNGEVISLCADCSTRCEEEMRMHSRGRPHNAHTEQREAEREMWLPVGFYLPLSFNNLPISIPLISIIYPPPDLPMFFLLPSLCSYNLHISALTSMWISVCGKLPREGGCRLSRTHTSSSQCLWAFILHPLHYFCSCLLNAFSFLILLPYVAVSPICGCYRWVNRCRGKRAICGFTQWWQWWLTTWVMTGEPARTDMA